MKKEMFIMVVLTVGLSGCAYTPTQYDKHFGDSAKATLKSQYVNPHPALSTEVSAIDGRASREIINNYYRSYSTPTSNNSAYTFQVGAGNPNGSGSGMQ